MKVDIMTPSAVKTLVRDEVKKELGDIIRRFYLLETKVIALEERVYSLEEQRK